MITAISAYVAIGSALFIFVFAIDQFEDGPVQPTKLFEALVVSIVLWPAILAAIIRDQMS